MWLQLCMVFAFALWLAHWCLWRGFLSKKRLPPSYYGFPLAGVLPFMFWKKDQLQMCQDIVDKRGPVFRVRMGLSDVVLVNGSTAVKEALRNDDLLGRPRLAFFELLRKIMHADPFVIMEGESWKTIRNFSVHALKDLGFGKAPAMEGKVQEEIAYLLDDLKRASSSPYDPRQSMLASVSNNIAILVFGDRLPYDHPRRKDLNRFLFGFIQAASTFMVFNFAPILLYVLNFIGIKAAKKFLAEAEVGKRVFVQETEQHLNNFDANDKRDFLDELIGKQKEDPEIFTPQVVRGSCIVFFGAGSNTTRIGVEYLVQLSAAYPDLQEQMHQEIVRVVGDARLPCWADRENLHLVNAFIQERHRIFPIAPLGIFRRALRDTKVSGFDVQRGTVVIYNIESVHFDKTVFENPADFKPGRFLDAEGKFVASNNVIPFAIGKRACPGEVFATFEIFLYFSAILQRFRVEALSKSQEVKLTKASQFFSEPIPQPLRFISRI